MSFRYRGAMETVHTGPAVRDETRDVVIANSTLAAPWDVRRNLETPDRADQTMKDSRSKNAKSKECHACHFVSDAQWKPWILSSASRDEYIMSTYKLHLFTVTSTNSTQGCGVPAALGGHQYLSDGPLSAGGHLRK